jgi:hypothetical protein
MECLLIDNSSERTENLLKRKSLMQSFTLPELFFANDMTLLHYSNRLISMALFEGQGKRDVCSYRALGICHPFPPCFLLEPHPFHTVAHYVALNYGMINEW